MKTLISSWKISGDRKASVEKGEVLSPPENASTEVQDHTEENKIREALLYRLQQRIEHWAVASMREQEKNARGRSIRAAAKDDLNEWRQRFERVRLLDEDEKSRLGPIVAKHVFWVAWIRYWLLNFTRRVVNIGSFALFFVSILGNLIFPHSNSTALVIGPAGLLFGVFVGMQYPLIRIGSLSLRNLADYLERMASRRRYWWVGPFFYFAAVFTDPGDPFHPVPKTLFGGASGLVTLLLLMAAGAWIAVHAHIWVNFSLQREREAMRPQSFITEGYTRLLFFLDGHPLFLRRPRSTHKRQFMALLEEVALVFRRDLWQPLGSGDRDTDAWSKKRADEMGNAVRSLKKWIITPKADTFGQLRDRVVADLTHAAQGEWDAMLTEEAVPTGLSRLMAAVAFILRVAAIAAFVALTLESTGHAPRWVVSDSAFILIVFAGAMTLLNRIDPTTSSTITSYKDILKSLEDVSKKP